MAKAAEGKTMDDTLDECGACKINYPIKYCVDCQMKLCSMCTNTHRNIPLTKGHQLNDIQTSKKQSKMTTAKCFKHKDELLGFLCKPCVELICTSCKPEHNGHDLLPLKDDPNTYHKVCTNHLHQLMDELQEVQAFKAILEGHIQTYDGAITVVDQWEIDLLKLVKDKAAKLRKKIQASRDEKVKQLSDKMNGLSVNIQEIDKTISRLTDVLKSTNPQILSTELSKSQMLIKKLESYKADLKSLPPASSVDRVLPHGDKIKNVDNDLEEMLKFTDFFAVPADQAPKSPIKHRGPLPVAEWHFTEASGGNDLSQYGENPITLKGVAYGLGPNGETNGAVILSTFLDQSMIVMNPSDKLRFTTDMTYFTHVYIDGQSRGPLFDYNTGATSQGILGTLVYVNADALQIRNSGLHFDVSNVITLNSWHKIGVVYCGSQISVYVNGCHVHTATGNVNLTQTRPGHIHIGRIPGFLGWILKGRMASAKFYNVALSENEIKQL